MQSFALLHLVVEPVVTKQPVVARQPRDLVGPLEPVVVVVIVSFRLDFRAIGVQFGVCAVLAIRHRVEACIKKLNIYYQLKLLFFFKCF